MNVSNVLVVEDDIQLVSNIVHLLGPLQVQATIASSTGARVRASLSGPTTSLSSI